MITLEGESKTLLLAFYFSIIGIIQYKVLKNLHNCVKFLRLLKNLRAIKFKKIRLDVSLLT